MAIKVNGTTVIDDSRALSNISSVDATTVAALGAAGVGGGGYTWSSVQSVSGTPSVAVTGLPSDVTDIKIMVYDFYKSSGGTSNGIQVRVGPSSGYLTSGYLASSVQTSQGYNANSAGDDRFFHSYVDTNSSERAIMEYNLTKHPSNNVWQCIWFFGRPFRQGYGLGMIDLGASVLSQVQWVDLFGTTGSAKVIIGYQ